MDSTIFGSVNLKQIQNVLVLIIYTCTCLFNGICAFVLMVYGSSF
jgi:hypothetical protein